MAGGLSPPTVRRGKLTLEGEPTFPVGNLEIIANFSVLSNDSDAHTGAFCSSGFSRPLLTKEDFNAQEDGAGRRRILTSASGERLVVPSCSTDRFQHRTRSPHGSPRNLPRSPRQSMSCLRGTPKRLTCRWWRGPQPQRSILQGLVRMFWTFFFPQFPYFDAYCRCVYGSINIKLVC
jgi:hypothetical protein